jgi:uncharacterized protein
MLLSVRGEARLVVPPDSATVMGTVRGTRGSKAEAVPAAAVSLDLLTADLAAHGGVALAAGTERHPLTWSAQSVSTYPEQVRDPETGRHEPNGLVTAAVEIVITVRAFELLDPLGAVLAADEALSVHQVSWDVDWDNPGWPQVRAAAIAAAIRKGRDYAAALGGSLRSVEHVADAGLLGGDGGLHVTSGRASLRASHAGSGAANPDTPALDPVPQELTAVIEARLVAGGVSLTAS